MISNRDLIVLIALIVILFSQASWIFFDARKRGEKQYLMWSFLGLIQCPTSLIVYLIVTRSIFAKVVCKECGRTVNADNDVCPQCGKELKGRCSKCNFIVEHDWNYCPNCSEKFKK